MPGSRWRALWLIPALAAFLFPLWWLISTSLQPLGKPPSRELRWWPEQPAPANFAAVFDMSDFGTFTLNSLLVAAAAVPVAVLVSSWAGFAMAGLPAGSRRWLVVGSFAVMMIPVTAIWIPRFILFQRLGLIDSRLALIVPALAGGSPLFALLFWWGYSRISPDVLEAARLDGASAFTAWRTIAFPLARPVTAAVAMLAFVASWGNFIDPLLYIQDAAKQTLPYGLQLLHQLDSTNWPLLMAAAAMTILPVTVVFLLAQRYLFASRPAARGIRR
jgi:multiple sugar transport system permease protein